MAQHIRTIGNLQRHVHVLFDQQDTSTGFIGDRSQNRQQTLNDDRSKSETHFVNHQQLRIHRECTSHCEHLLFTTRQQASTTIKNCFESRKVTQGLLDICRTFSGPQLQVLGHGQLIEQSATLGNMSKAITSNHVRATTLD